MTLKSHSISFMILNVVVIPIVALLLCSCSFRSISLQQSIPTTTRQYPTHLLPEPILHAFILLQHLSLFFQPQILIVFLIFISINFIYFRLLLHFSSLKSCFECFILIPKKTCSILYSSELCRKTPRSLSSVFASSSQYLQCCYPRCFVQSVKVMELVTATVLLHFVVD